MDGFLRRPYARTPNVDRLAAQSVHYTRVFATAPVCSPARFALISGLHANAMGTQHLRSTFPVSASMAGFPAALRAAGYYCTNNVKTDYNCAAEARWIRESWDESSPRAHWRNRPAGAPFFAVFNLMETHQGPTNVNPETAFEREIGARLSAEERHDPARAIIPPYYPDTPTVRKTLARVHDCITAMDRRVGELLAELDVAGLAESTIVFFYPDHGQGIPRGKRTLYDSGLHVPLLIRFPAAFQSMAPSAPGTRCDRLVSFVDFGATVQSLCGIRPAAGTHARPFLGPFAAPPREFVHGARDRVDEALDLSRSVRDGRFLYIRNYMPHLPHLAPEGFSDQSPLRQELVRMARAGEMAFAGVFGAPRKPAEELYDTERDPWQMHNLVDNPAAAGALKRLRAEHRRWMAEIRDLGFLPEWRAAQLSALGRPVVEAADDAMYPFDRVFDTASLCGMPGAEQRLLERLKDPDPAVRWWAALGLRAATERSDDIRPALQRASGDPCPPLALEAAALLVEAWDDAAALAVLAGAVRSADPHEALYAARSLQMLGARARDALPAMKKALARAQEGGDYAMYLRFSLAPAVAALSGATPG